MTDQICSIEGCGKPRRALTWCAAHYTRHLRHGDPLGGRRTPAPTAEYAVATFVMNVGGCLIWQGAINAAGYGRINKGGRSISTHKVAYEMTYGPVPTGRHIDHRCWNRACVNPEHLRLATPAENVRYRQGPERSRKLFLPRGVSVGSHGKGFRGRVSKNGTEHSARFVSAEEAAAWAADKRRELFGEFAGRG